MEGEIKNVMRYWMVGEITNFIKVWLSIYTTLSYCYLAAKSIPKGVGRLFAFLPAVCLFLYLPLTLHSMHLGGTTAFFAAWLLNFKLLLFAFATGPLSDPSVSSSLLRFIAVSCLPIKIQPRSVDGKAHNTKNGGKQDDPVGQSRQKGGNSALIYAAKILLTALFLKVYDFSDVIHPRIIMIVFSFHVYFLLEMILATAAALARGLLGVELEPQFHQPLLSTSLQDFWSRRWNLMVTRILRPSVYDPVLGFSTRIIGRSLASIPAILATFTVSAAMHELIFYYLGRSKPTWEITWFFMLHGVSLVAEVGAKKALRGKIRLPRIVGTILTVGFVMSTGFWLFFPQLLKCGALERGLKEYEAVGAFLKDLAKALKFTPFTKSSNSTTLLQ